MRAPSGSVSSSTAATTAWIAPFTLPGSSPKKRLTRWRCTPRGRRAASRSTTSPEDQVDQQEDAHESQRRDPDAERRRQLREPLAGLPVPQERGRQAGRQRQQVQRREQESARPAGRGADQHEDQKQRIDQVEIHRPSVCAVAERTA